MRRKISVMGARLLVVFVLLGLTVSLTVPAQAASEEDIQTAINDGIAWLVAQQNPDGSWGTFDQVGTTALAVKKLEHHCVDTKWGLGLPSPFDTACPYSDNITNGFNYIFANACNISISAQPAGNPDSDNDGIGVYFADGGCGGNHATYCTGIALMAIAESVAPDRIVNAPGSPVNGWTYYDVAVDAVDYLAFGQNDAGNETGGWGYDANDVGWSDNSNTGYAVLGLQYAQEPPPEGFSIPIPQFVKDELCIWVEYIQCDPTDSGWDASLDGGSGYGSGIGYGPCYWCNVLKTGHLLKEMEFAGGDCGREQAAIDYLVRHWGDDADPGWRPNHYQAMYTIMKGLVATGHIDPAVIDGIYWQDDFDDAIVAQQEVGGNWSGCPTFCWPPDELGDCPTADDILCTEWALLTLQKVTPPPPPPPPPTPPGIPSLSQWGVVIMAGLFAGLLVWTVRRRTSAAGKR
ncbi:MAG: IPTL-CTERM sorting domain-containing protein [Dehalococcoidia bacterium]